MTEKREASNMRTTGTILAILALFLLAIALARVDGKSAEAASASAAGTSAWMDFTLKDVEGAKVSLGKFIGQRPVLLYFWATWCPRCRESVPDINRIHRDPAGHTCPDRAESCWSS